MGSQEPPQTRFLVAIETTSRGEPRPREAPRHRPERREQPRMGVQEHPPRLAAEPLRIERVRLVELVDVVPEPTVRDALAPPQRHPARDGEGEEVGPRLPRRDPEHADAAGDDE